MNLWSTAALSLLIVLSGAACGESATSPQGVLSGGGGGGGVGGSGGNGGGAAQAGAAQGGSLGGQGGAAAGSGGFGGLAGSGGTGAGSGSSGSGGSSPVDSSTGQDATADASQDRSSSVDTGVRDIVTSGDADLSKCCVQIPKSECRVQWATWQTCWRCAAGCFDSIRPTTPVEPITKCGCDGRPGGQRCFKFENRCSYAVRARTDTLTKDLNPGECATEFRAKGTRVWGETNCQTGTCDKGWKTLAELNLQPTDDWYDLSHVDGANLPLGMYPVKGTFTPYTGNEDCRCRSRECRVDIKNTTCKPANQVKNGSGQVTSCNAQCAVASTADKPYACCQGVANVPQVCLATTASIQVDYQMFRFPCPEAYSYAYDEANEVDAQYVLCKCGGGKVDYDFVFCP
jgi:hypothetical protein